MEQNDLFQLIPIFKRISDQQLAEYVCIYNLDTKQYAVLCTNFYNSTSSNDDHAYFKKLIIELLLEESPLSRCKWFSSIEQAINQHDLEFS
ncbi:hypothetical protein GCM10025882_17880 [Acinetobacter gyllenbergii]|uniref:Uncharacterized protein n=1 Tax=Acinetobacter gyllenbergii CIP 110306 = MTCC 11365 TaxID=1217657 RepID=A0A829HDM9_9GAMM|nr:hypothetical protein [Acinetobacter gyllenbergii]EPF69555.1 hypothetical protein F957_04126 [Acinetobacter gyllenbergii CIP 110306 = MTCC 11365]GMA11363.1 hypothetical protein GCM10025882_17880 [Acinetobacter gyllenbergii]